MHIILCPHDSIYLVTIIFFRIFGKWREQAVVKQCRRIGINMKIFKHRCLETTTENSTVTGFYLLIVNIGSCEMQFTIRFHQILTPPFLHAKHFRKVAEHEILFSDIQFTFYIKVCPVVIHYFFIERGKGHHIMQDRIYSDGFTRIRVQNRIGSSFRY